MASTTAAASNKVSKGKSRTAPSSPRGSTVSRWGNSLGVRFPQDAVERLQLKAGGRVSVEINDDSITIRPLRKRRKWTEAQLLKGVTPAQVGGEIDWGKPLGKEAW